ncbi:hypothetical protein [Xanthobacter sediminis]|uniref:hypothetical protein n=1 Tax=Xanthobacter sediminis TaxID=3119926 RepID=UPI0037295B1B
MRRLYIHVGTHKTGTTSIQWYLSRHARTFRGYGFHVPQAGRIARGFAGHHNVAWTMLEDTRAEPRQGGLDAVLIELDMARAVRAVLSSEDFEFLADRPFDLRRFEGRILSAGWTPVYIMFLRAQGSYMLSVYHELSKRPDHAHFGAFSEEVLARGTFRSRQDHVLHFDYDLLVAKWRAMTKGELRIIAYDAAAKGRGVVGELVRVMDAPARLGELRQTRINASTGTVTDDMRAAAQRVETKYLPSFMRQTGLHG